MENIKNSLRTMFNITDENILNCAAKASRVVTLSKGEHLSKWERPFTDVAFLMSGLFRFYVLDSKGNEHTDCFSYHPWEPVVPYISFDDPLPINIQALEDSSVLILPANLILTLVNENMDTMRVYNRLLTLSLQQHWNVKMVLYKYDAAERYRWFMENFGDVAHRIPHGHIASYLGITPVTLSRIKGQYKQQLDNK